MDRACIYLLPVHCNWSQLNHMLLCILYLNKPCNFTLGTNSLKIMVLADLEIITVVQLVMAISYQELTMGNDRRLHQTAFVPSGAPFLRNCLTSKLHTTATSSFASHISPSQAQVVCNLQIWATPLPRSHRASLRRLPTIRITVLLRFVTTAHTLWCVISKSELDSVLLTFKKKYFILLPFALSSCEWNDRGVVIITCYGWLVL